MTLQWKHFALNKKEEDEEKQQRHTLKFTAIKMNVRTTGASTNIMLKTIRKILKMSPQNSQQTHESSGEISVFFKQASL